MVTRPVWLGVASIFTMLILGAPRPERAQAQPAQASAQAPVILTLDEATRLALEHNHSLRAQRLAIDQAKA